VSTGRIVLLVVIGLLVLLEGAELMWGIGELFADVVDWLREVWERRRSRRKPVPR
jgi:hypothetical protein